MFAVVGTVPDEAFPLVCAQARVSEKNLVIGNHCVPVNRGTPALLAAAAKACEFLEKGPPEAILAGDIGRGGGSRQVYAHLEQALGRMSFASLTFHYIQPDVDWHNRVLFALEEMPEKPFLIADAGFMYAAKMSGQAAAYDVFTPDLGELAFLADPDAPHPFYTRGFIFHEPHRAQELIAAAYAHQNASTWLLVKGKQDLVANAKGISETVSHPVVSAMEAIGGTGDLITGLAAAFSGPEKDPLRVCIQAAAVSRLAGALADPNPGTPVIEIIEHIPAALEQFFE